MKSVIYRNPVISAIIMNLMGIVWSIYIVNQRLTSLALLLVPIGIANRRIIEKGQNIDTQKEIIIYTSCLLMIVIFCGYATFVNVRGM